MNEKERFSLEGGIREARLLHIFFSPFFFYATLLRKKSPPPREISCFVDIEFVNSYSDQLYLRMLYLKENICRYSKIFFDK